MTRGQHPSDDPGITPPVPDAGERGEHRGHSGSNSPSPPRRPGTGERQAARRRVPGNDTDGTGSLVPGEVLYGDEPIVINEGADVATIRVTNTADRPIQVGSHYHFAEANPRLEFDRKAAWGRRLNVLSGGSVRFEPGAVEEVELIPIRGQRIVAGLRGEAAGSLDG